MTTRDVVFSICLAISMFINGFLVVMSIMLFMAVGTATETMHEQRKEYLDALQKERGKNERMQDYIKRTKRVDRD